jgi:hypothetical protein
LKVAEESGAGNGNGGGGADVEARKCASVRKESHACKIMNKENNKANGKAMRSRALADAQATGALVSC